MIGGWDCLSTGYLRYLLNLNRGKTCMWRSAHWEDMSRMDWR